MELVSINREIVPDDDQLVLVRGINLLDGFTVGYFDEAGARVVDGFENPKWDEVEFWFSLKL